MQRCMGCMAEFDDGIEVCPYCGYLRGTPAREAYHLTPESILQGRYIVGRVLGYGGFGVTYIGYDAQLDRIVAIKEFLPSTFATRMPGNTVVTVYDGAATEQFGTGLSHFVEEAQTLAQFNGIPGIVDIYDTFTGNNTAYIVMQYLQGQDMKDILSAGGPLPYAQAKDIILKVCDTLEPVHAQGIIHRDISPDNIYITTSGEVKLLDFGAARYESAVNSKSLSVILKSGYAPEEQYRSRGDQGPWTDIYALAATFYKLLTGATPDDSMERAINDELKEPSKLGIELPQNGENAIMNALNIHKSDRPQSVADFRAALLNDGTARVKVKQHKSDAGKVPTWAKATIIGSAALLMLLGFLTLTGILDFGQGNLLSDNFGKAVKDGFVSVPTLTGITEEEATKQLEKLGLVMKVGSYNFMRDVESGMITEQAPSPGKAVEVGSEVTVTVSMGGLIDAMQSGRVKSFTEMGAIEALSFVRNSRTDVGVSFEYRYSDDVAAGDIVGYEAVDAKEGGQYLQVYLSAGADNAAPPLGELRAAYIEGYGDLSIRYAVASAKESDEEQAELRVMMSDDDGATWKQLHYQPDYYTESYYFSDEMKEKHLPHNMYVGARNVLPIMHPELEGKALRFRLERYHYGNEKSGLIDSIEIPQTYTFSFTEKDLAITKVETLAFDEIEKLADEGYFDEHHHVSWILKEKKERGADFRKEDYTGIKIEGNFEENHYYNVSYNVPYHGTGITCEKDGELYTLEYNHELTNNEFGTGAEGMPFEVIVSSSGDSTMDDKGNITNSYTRPARGMSEGTAQAIDIRGMRLEEAIEKLRSELEFEEGKPLSHTVNVAESYSNFTPFGEVEGWDGYKNDDGVYSNVNVYISLGPRDGPPRVLLAYSDAYEGDLDSEQGEYAYFYGVMVPGTEYKQIKVLTSYSTDGGNTWSEEEGYTHEIDTSERNGQVSTYPGTYGRAVRGMKGDVKGRIRLENPQTGEELYELVYDYVKAEDATFYYPKT